MAGKRTEQRFDAIWIWGSGGAAFLHRNEHVYLRKTFRLGSEPAAAPVRISADNRYQLWVNGKLVCRGPARCEPRFQAYDEIDLAPHLRKGKNCLAVLAHHFGESTFQSIDRGGYGFLLDGAVHCRRGKPVPVHTDRTWKAIRAEAYSRDSSRYCEQLGFQEDFDAARAPLDWTKPGFDDRNWPEASGTAGATTMPFERLEPRGIPFGREAPARFIAATGQFVGRNLNNYRSHTDLGLLLADERRSPAGKDVFRNVPAVLRRGPGHATVSPTPAGRFHAVVLDAGRETCGFLNLEVEAAGGEIIDVFYCEHVRDNGDAICQAANGGLAHMADRYRCRPGRQRHQFFAWKGFRYVLAVFRDVRRPLRVHHIDYTFTSYPVERRGALACSDPLLNRIWETGAYTQQLCMHDAYVDCPWREQAQWWGDARVQWRVNMAVFDDHALFKRGLRQGGQSQTHEGLTYGLFPSEAHGCILPDYTLVWVCSIWDYYFYTGDDGPIREHFDRVVRALGWFEALCGSTHLCPDPGFGYWLFLDWAPLFKGGYSTTFTLQYLEALQFAARMARHLGRESYARKWTVLARKVERAAIRAFWDARGKRFYEGCRIGTYRHYRQVAQHGNAYAILTGIQKRWHDRMADRILWIMNNHDRLFANNAGGNIHHPKAKHPIASSFFYAYVLQALFQIGRGREALDGIRKLWGRMLEQGATTWFESWDHRPATYGNTSACHAWSASPTYHLSEQIGGVTPTAPGFATVRIAPQMFDLDHARVRTPTPHGPIDVEWQRTGGNGMDLSIDLPRPITASLELPGTPRRTLKPGTHSLHHP